MNMHVSFLRYLKCISSIELQTWENVTLIEVTGEKQNMTQYPTQNNPLFLISIFAKTGWAVCNRKIYSPKGVLPIQIQPNYDGLEENKTVDNLNLLKKTHLFQRYLFTSSFSSSLEVLGLNRCCFLSLSCLRTKRRRRKRKMRKSCHRRCHCCCRCHLKRSWRSRCCLTMSHWRSRLHHCCCRWSL